MKMPHRFGLVVCGWSTLPRVAEAISAKSLRMTLKQEPNVPPMTGDPSAPVDGSCHCVNFGTQDGKGNRFAQPESEDANSQKWVDTALIADGTEGADDRSRDTQKYKDTPYGVTYAKQHNGPWNYGEYCRGWEDEMTGGKAGTNNQCKINDDKGNDISGDRPSWCMQKWCYLRKYAANQQTQTVAGEGNPVAKSVNDTSVDKPQCNNIPAGYITESTYGNKKMYFSYFYCDATATTTTTTTPAGSLREPLPEPPAGSLREPLSEPLSG